MKMLEAKLRAFVLINLMMTMGGCMAGSGKVIAKPSDLTVMGHILSVSGIGVFNGDVVMEWYSYTFEPQGQSGVRIVIVGDRSDCPISSDNSSIYKLSLQKRSLNFAIRRKADEALMSELFIAACERIPTAVST